MPPVKLTHQLSNSKAKPSFSEVLKANRKPSNYIEAADSAVHTDLRQKDSRKNSIVVYGLPTGQGDEKISVSQLFKAEFNINTDILVCKRLGQQQIGKIQPLLITLKNQNHASQIITEAKKLRRSVNTVVRNQVFVNPHLTKAEAMAAYEQRCQRRLHKQRPATSPLGDEGSHRQVESSPVKASITTSTITLSADVDHNQVLASTIQTTGDGVQRVQSSKSANHLNAAASNFVPTSDIASMSAQSDGRPCSS